ncbi:proline iminopeptidase [Segniliparus rotundus DSM 44985]|uniref:Proline iminopeptidase n=1 Tax=Segniliparus rotundus (strain ATCC BAA-972 / CDC 1076 / CIP 108378 / DSM 44985 / JCM 13578) TaxID=640132 RepID=D6ZCG9_SEGRD|nr:prolyl aminopeptidase [Segniliparus rotundus]ADG97011.1 proline iminopeptidase [Segniliparus rotundus DSM 44985]
MRSLYPEIEPRATGHLDVGDGQRIFWEQVGNPEGKPAVFLHGGPGGGINPKQRRFFDPKRYNVLLFDQRGCGRSTPHAGENPDLSLNTTWNLVSDIEKLREQMGVERWLVFGGSWGSTLALAYAQTHPERVSELVLRGVFLCRESELDWFYNPGGASQIFPDLWEEYLAPIPPAARGGNLIEEHAKLLWGRDQSAAEASAFAWTGWEDRTIGLTVDPHDREKDPRTALAFARIENWYFQNKAFLRENQLLEDVDKIRHIPAAIVHGRYDVICPVASAWELHRRWPESKLTITAQSGHTAFEAENTHHLVEATDAFAQ